MYGVYMFWCGTSIPLRWLGLFGTASIQLLLYRRGFIILILKQEG